MQIDINTIIISIVAFAMCLLNLVVQMRTKIVASQSYSMAINHISRFKVPVSSFGEWTLAVINGSKLSKKTLIAAQEFKTLFKFSLIPKKLRTV